MSSIFWFLFFISNYFCLFSFNTMMMGLFLLGSSFCISMLMSSHGAVWYGLMFFMVYMGGLLVLFMYISSLKFNPAFYMIKNDNMISIFLKSNMAFLFFWSVSQITWKFSDVKWTKLDKNNFSLNLFNEEEMLFLVIVGFLLLVVLWLMAKLSFRSRGALRPLYLKGIMS